MGFIKDLFTGKFGADLAGPPFDFDAELKKALESWKCKGNCCCRTEHPPAKEQDGYDGWKGKQC